MARFALPGSERQPAPGSRSAGSADPAERLQVSVVLHRGAGEALPAAVQRLATGGARDHLTREAFAARFGARPEDVDAVRKFAAAQRLTVVQADAARGTVVLSGTVAAVNAAFGVTLQRFEHPRGAYRGRTGPVQLPDSLRDAVVAVLGLDNRPVARPYVRRRPSPGGVLPHVDAGTDAAFDPRAVAALYGFPPGSGEGVCVGIIELGGGYRSADLQAYFSALGIGPTPQVVAVGVDGQVNQPTGDPSGPDAEVMLDIELVGAIAPRARIVVYFAPNTDAGFLDALTTAAHDTVNRPSVISISWGAPEAAWTDQAIAAFDSALLAAAAMGITVCVASGDSGSSDGIADGADHVDFPASSPHALACGGTRLQARDGAIASEAAWNDGGSNGAGGGGVSGCFAVPPWQVGLSVTKAGQSSRLAMRGVPDVSSNADPETGYRVRVDGSNTVLGGTSAAAPLWAGLIARINAMQGRPVGFVTPALYRSPGALRDIARGSNGDFTTARGWDACTGLGSPNGMQAAVVLQASGQAGG